jgi:hypothetical protein
MDGRLQAQDLVDDCVENGCTSLEVLKGEIRRLTRGTQLFQLLMHSLIKVRVPTEL